MLATPQSEESATTVPPPGATAEYPHVLSLCNSLGTTVDTKQLSFEPLHVAMTEHYVFAASREHFYAWHFRTAKTWTVEVSRRQNRSEMVYHVDDASAAAAGSGKPVAMDSITPGENPTNDPICCLSASDKILVVGRESGQLLRYALPSLTFTNKYATNTKPYKMDINCNSL